MNFPHAVRLGLSQYARFAGRASRSEFWYFYLFYLLMDVGCSLLDRGLLQVAYGQGPITLINALVLLLPFISVQCRRLHDIDKRAWLLLKWYAPFLIVSGLLLAHALLIMLIALMMKVIPNASDLLSALFFLVSFYQQPFFIPVALILVGLSALAPTLAMLIFSLRKGTVGDNRFGPDPLMLPATIDSLDEMTCHE